MQPFMTIVLSIIWSKMNNNSCDFSVHICNIIIIFIVVTGKAQSSDGAGPSGVAPPTGLVYSSDTVLVRVVRLTGIKIIVPAIKLVAGEEVE